jgi:hypothetical protein
MTILKRIVRRTVDAVLTRLLFSTDERRSGAAWPFDHKGRPRG